jgi:hypothetical protein
VSCQKRPHSSSGGTIINIITALIFFGLLAGGVLWLIKGFGDVGKQYNQAMVNATHKAEMVRCQTNLRAIDQNIQMYAISNDGFPPSLEALVQYSGTKQLFHCPDPNGVDYVYIPGQNPDMPPDNVLVYEPKPMHEGRCSVLRLNGELDLLTPDQLQQALERTRATIR